MTDIVHVICAYYVLLVVGILVFTYFYPDKISKALEEIGLLLLFFPIWVPLLIAIWIIIGPPYGIFKLVQFLGRRRLDKKAKRPW